MATAVSDMIDNDLALCEVLIFGNTNASILKRMIGMAHDSSIAIWRRLLKKASPVELELLFVCLSNGLLHVVVEGYHVYDRATVIGFFNTMVKNSLAAYV